MYSSRGTATLIWFGELMRRILLPLSIESKARLLACLAADGWVALTTTGTDHSSQSPRPGMTDELTCLFIRGQHDGRSVQNQLNICRWHQGPRPASNLLVEGLFDLNVDCHRLLVAHGGSLPSLSIKTVAHSRHVSHLIGGS